MSDIILINGKIITVDPDDSIAEALAIKDGKIIAVGSTKDIRKLAGKNTKVIDLNGRTATPGLIDSHIHFSGTSMLYVLDVSYPTVKSIADVVAAVQKQVGILQPGEWVQGRGWDEGKLAENRYIYAADLDPVSPNNPVYLTHTTGHYAVANSLALQMAGITKDTPDPPGGTIDRYPDGTPTGVLKEAARSPVSRLIPSFTEEQQTNGLLKIIEEVNKEGMTGIKDGGGGVSSWNRYQKVLGMGKLNVRMFALRSGGSSIAGAQSVIDSIAPFSKPYISTGDDNLISGGIKMYIDGSGGARTAWLYDEWNKNYDEIDTGNYGYPTMDPDLFRQIVTMYHNAGLNVNVHAIGDLAIDWYMETLALAQVQNPIYGLRHGIIHCNIPTEWSLDTMAWMQKALDAGYPLSQPAFTWWLGDVYAGNFGPARNPRLNPFKTFLERGIMWGGGSDFSVDPFAAKTGLYSAITRKTLLGVWGWYPFGTDECIDIRTALRAYTIWNAHQLFLEDKVGSLEAGKYADIAIWDKDMYTIPPEELLNMKCLMTLFNGNIVWQDPDGWQNYNGNHRCR
jgi:predicted amidohydrolase YtcJ